jgi:fatty acid desaturase
MICATSLSTRGLALYSAALLALLALSAWRPYEAVTWAIALAWIGAMVAQALLSRWHDRQLAALVESER